MRERGRGEGGEEWGGGREFQRLLDIRAGIISFLGTPKKMLVFSRDVIH